MYFCYYSSPIGELLLVADDTGIRRLTLPKHGEPAAPETDWSEDPQRLAPAREQLDAYFAGQLTEFDLQLAPTTTPFQGRVLSALRKVPYGTTVSYGDLARDVGNPAASRAVGMANGRNPIAIIIPCHRVIGSDGRLVGYGGGLEAKRRLLQLEREVMARR
jgi:methylated-DNA-[protein]-cysteine S-methyltransferase